MDELGYGLSQVLCSKVAAEVTRGIEVSEGATGVLTTSSAPGRVRCNQYTLTKKTRIARIAIHPMKDLCLLISYSVACLYCTTVCKAFTESLITIIKRQMVLEKSVMGVFVTWSFKKTGIILMPPVPIQLTIIRSTPKMTTCLHPFFSLAKVSSKNPAAINALSNKVSCLDHILRIKWILR
jgi:hypothetical protein